MAFKVQEKGEKDEVKNKIINTIILNIQIQKKPTCNHYLFTTIITVSKDLTYLHSTY